MIRENPSAATRGPALPALAQQAPQPAAELGVPLVLDRADGAGGGQLSAGARLRHVRPPGFADLQRSGLPRPWHSIQPQQLLWRDCATARVLQRLLPRLQRPGNGSKEPLHRQE
jgi:hypothetical protein